MLAHAKAKEVLAIAPVNLLIVVAWPYYICINWLSPMLLVKADSQYDATTFMHLFINKMYIRPPLHMSCDVLTAAFASL